MYEGVEKRERSWLVLKIVWPEMGSYVTEEEKSEKYLGERGERS